MESKLRKKTIWNFKYKGFSCEIVNWNFQTDDSFNELERPTGNWNYYIYILKDQLSNEDFKKLLCKVKKFKLSKERKYWEYYHLDSCFDMHGGITFYELLRNEFSGKKIGIKVGCDYVHSWDIGQIYNEVSLESDCKKSVDTFIKNFPDYLVWDYKDGEYRKPDQLLVNKQ